MNKKCARCDKIVYPIEELKCLDKVFILLICIYFFLSNVEKSPLIMLEMIIKIMLIGCIISSVFLYFLLYVL